MSKKSLLTTPSRPSAQSAIDLEGLKRDLSLVKTAINFAQSPAGLPPSVLASLGLTGAKPKALVKHLEDVRDRLTLILKHQLAAPPEEWDQPRAYQIKITLKDSKPPIWRRVLVRSDITLGHLHQVIQAAMGWFNAHLHAFYIADLSYGMDHPELDLELQDDYTEDEVRLFEVFGQPQAKARYGYDFGDGWSHTLLLEKVLPLEQPSYPQCIGGKRACPPEDCGGVWGYAEMLDILANPKHREYKTYRDWVGGHFDPEAFSLEATNQRLSQLFKSTKRVR